jgi:hypothetical protein
MPSARFEPAVPASEWPQTYALDSATTEIATDLLTKIKLYQFHYSNFNATIYR